MPHIGVMELGILLLVVLFVFGAGRLPEVGGAIGRGIRDFRRSQSDMEERSEAADPPKRQGAKAG